MATYDLAEAAERTGVSVDELSRLVELGILTPDLDEHRFTPGHLRRADWWMGPTAAGIPLEGLGAAIRSGQVSLDFLDAPAFERLALSGVTFAQMAERTGVSVQLLMFIREASGSVAPRRAPTIGCGTTSSRTPIGSRWRSRPDSVPPVELKGMTGSMRLHAAHRPG